MRPAFLAGTWYPESSEDCRRAIQTHARGAALVQGRWRGILAPHAGWRYSGTLAAQTFASLQAARPAADLVVVFGSHRGPAGPNTVLRASGWETPLGAAMNATELAARVATELHLEEEPVHPLAADNGIEVLLPFVRHFFSAAKVLAVGVAAAPVALAIGERVGQLCREAGHDAVFVGSTDLTHYGPAYHWTDRGPAEDAVPWVRDVNDAEFLALATQAGDAAPLKMLEHARLNRSACCPGAAAAARRAAAVFEAEASFALVGHALSYDAAPGPSFVGYAGVLF